MALVASTLPLRSATVLTGPSFSTMNSLEPWPVTPSWISSLMTRRSSMWAFCIASAKEEKASGPMSSSSAASAVMTGGVPSKRVVSTTYDWPKCLRMSFFARMSGARDAGTTTQPTRIFTGSVWARAMRPAASAAPIVTAPTLNLRRLIHVFMAFPPVFVHQGLLIAAKACYRPPPTQKRAIEPGEGLQGPLVREASTRCAGPPFGRCGVGNGSDFKRRSARSIYLRRCAVEARPVRHPAVGCGHSVADHPQRPAQYPDYRLGHGHCHRNQHGDRHGAGGGHWRHSPQSRTGCGGGAGPTSQEIRVRHGREPGHGAA